jgi:hypothetical protein
MSGKPDTLLSDNLPRTRTSNFLADTRDVNLRIASKIADRKPIWLSLGQLRPARPQPDNALDVDEE